MFFPASQITIETVFTASIGSIVYPESGNLPLIIVGKIGGYKAFATLEKKGDYSAFELHGADKFGALRGVSISNLRFELDPASGVIGAQDADVGFTVRSLNSFYIYCRASSGRELLQIADFEETKGITLQGFFGSWRAVCGEISNPTIAFERR